MNILSSNKKKFEKICFANQLTIDSDTNKDHFFLLKSIFEGREYADHFPFYENAVIVDIGAHAGYFSLFASLNLDVASRVVAVEPDANNFMLLRKNIFDSKRQNIETLNVAISDRDGEAVLHQGNSVNHSLVENYRLIQNEAKASPVRVMSPASLFSHFNLEKIDFLKIDCEGAEYSIILNSPSDTFQKVKTISMEFHDLKDVRFTGKSLCARLNSEGFRIVRFQHEPTTMGLNFGKIIATREW